MAWNGGESKVCRCCGRVYDETAWKTLRYVGELDDGVDVIEIRDSECGSSIAVFVRPSLPDTEPAPAVCA